MVRGAAPHHYAVEQEETTTRGMGPCHRVGEWKDMMARGTAPHCHAVKRKETTTRGKALIIAMFNSKKQQ
jgi:hypothetical protein